MGGCAEEQELRGAQPQHLAAGRVGALQRPFDQGAQDLLDLAQAPHRGGQQQPHEGAVARIEHGKAPVAGQRLVERLALVEAGDQDVEGGVTGGEWRGIHCAAL